MQLALSAVYRGFGLTSRQVYTDVRRPIQHWNRPCTEVDLVVEPIASPRPQIVAELKVWDIGHQLFDLIKCCCLLAAGAEAASLACIARQPGDFVRKPGGELFAEKESEKRIVDVGELLARHSLEWASHVGNDRPEPVRVPARIATRAVGAPVEIEAYPEHQLRTAQVEIVDETWLPTPP